MKIILILIVLIENYILYKMSYNLGIRHEQQARLRRLNALKRLIGTGE